MRHWCLDFYNWNDFDDARGDILYCSKFRDLPDVGTNPLHKVFFFNFFVRGNNIFLPTLHKVTSLTIDNFTSPFKLPNLNLMLLLDFCARRDWLSYTNVERVLITKVEKICVNMDPF